MSTFATIGTQEEGFGGGRDSRKVLPDDHCDFTNGPNFLLLALTDSLFAARTSFREKEGRKGG